MANTSFDLTRAGVFFQNAAISIHQRVQQDLHTLDFPHIQELLNKEQELAIKSKTLFVMAVVKIGEEAKNSFESLEDASQQIDEVIRKVEKIQDVIDFSTTLEVRLRQLSVAMLAK